MSRARAKAVEVARLFDEAPAPVYVLDDQRQIAYCNPSCAEWLGMKPAELLGQQVNYHPPASEGDPRAGVAGLCPPPKAFCGSPQSGLVSRVAEDGALAYRSGHFLPLDDGADESAPVLAVLALEDCAPAAVSGNGQASGDVCADDRLHDELRHFRRQMAGHYQVDALLGRSPAIMRARAQVDLATRSAAPVLILGPRGVGKEHVAKTIHYLEPDPGTLVPLACDALEPNLLRSTLRALRARNAGATRSAGTLLLSHVREMPADAQADLVEMLRDNTLRMRVIATAAQPLEMPIEGEPPFSRELACALSTLTIALPPLAERIEDLPLLAQAFLEELNASGGKQVGGFTAEAIDQLSAYPWPGNVAELRSFIHEAHQRASGGEVTAGDLPQQITLVADATAHPPRRDEPIVLEEFLAQVERELIVRALRRAKGNKSRAAKLLGLTRPRLYRRLVQLGMAEREPGE